MLNVKSGGEGAMISIIIVNYGTKGHLRQALKSVRRHAGAEAHEILVVDNASRDGSAKMVREAFPEVRLFALEENVGFARGNNLAMREAKGDFFFIMNPDAMLTEGALGRMRAFMEERPDVGMLGPRLKHPDGSLQESAHRFPSAWTPIFRRTPLGRLSRARTEMDRYNLKGELGSEPLEVDWMEGAALFVRRDAASEVGLFDERFFIYMEDADWARRFWRAGWKVVWFPGATVLHYHRRESRDGLWFLAPLTNRVSRIHIMSAVKYFLKWRGEPHPRAGSKVPTPGN